MSDTPQLEPVPVTPGAGLPAVTPAPIVTPASGNALTWPFLQKNWFGSFALLLIGLIPFIVPGVLNLGWMMEASAREAEHNPDRMPRLRSVLFMWLHGVFYALMTICYFVIPGIVFGAIYSATVSSIGSEIVDWTIYYAANQALAYVNDVIAFTTLQLGYYPIESENDFIYRILTEYSGAVIPPVLFFILSAALFLASLVRYAATRKLTSFFRPFKNLKLVTMHLPSFLWTYLIMFAMNLAFASLHVIGFILWATLGMWIYAHLIGRLAVRFRDKHEI